MIIVDIVHIVIQIDMICVGDNHEFLVADCGALIFDVFAGHLFERPLTEIAAVRICAMYNENGIDDFVGVGEELGIQETERTRLVPAVRRVE